MKRTSRRKTEKQAPVRLFGQPAPGFYRMPDLVVRGGRVVTDGCRRVLDFTPQKLCLDMGSAIITLYGDALQIESLSNRRLIASGQIQRIEFAGKWKGIEVCGAKT